MHIARRALVGIISLVLAVSTVMAPLAHADDDQIDVLVATNEPYGSYHIKQMVDYVNEQGGRIALVSPDLEHKADDGVEVITLDQADEWGADLLVVNGATEWPATVVEALPNVPVVASSLAYLNPERAKFADAIRPRLVGTTAQSSDEAKEFATHFGLNAEDIEVVGNMGLDDVGAYNPTKGTVLIATSVTRPNETGGAAPGTQLLLDTAAALDDEGYHIRVGLHPREDRSLWEQYEIADEGTIAAASSAEVVVGIPGSVFPPIAAIGAPLVGITDPALTVPDYLLKLSAKVGSVDEAVAAVKAAWKPDPSELEAVVGPVGGAKERLWVYWLAAVQQGETDEDETPSEDAPDVEESEIDTDSSESDDSAPETSDTVPGLPSTGVGDVRLAA